MEWEQELKRIGDACLRQGCTEVNICWPWDDKDCVPFVLFKNEAHGMHKIEYYPKDKSVLLVLCPAGIEDMSWDSIEDFERWDGSW